MPSAAASSFGLATLFRNLTPMSTGRTAHSRRQAFCIALSIQLGFGCASGSIQCSNGYRSSGKSAAAAAYLVSQITFFAVKISLLVYQAALSVQAVVVPRLPSGALAGGGA